MAFQNFMGKEEWERMSIDAVNIIASPTGNYFALITNPFGFSYDGKEFCYWEYDEKSKFSLCMLPDRFLRDEGQKTLLSEILCKSI